MNTSVITTRIASANVALLAGVNFTERCGVIISRSEYSQVRGASANKSALRHVFVVRLDGGIGSEFVTIDQAADATSALLEGNDQVNVRISDDVHFETTVAPIFGWGKADGNVDGRVLRTASFRNANGETSEAKLVLGSAGLVVVESRALECSVIDGADYVERVGVIMRRAEYTSPRKNVNVPRIGAQSPRRVEFLVRLDGGIGSELVTIDQTSDETTALLRENDQVQVRMINDAHIESTVSPVFAWAKSDAPCFGRILRMGDFQDGAGITCVSQLVLTNDGLRIDVTHPDSLRN